MNNKFIIVSQPRTGSNNLSYMLNAHPEVSVGNELLHPVNGVQIDESIKSKYKKKIHGNVLDKNNSHKKMGSDFRAKHWSDQFEFDALEDVVKQIFQKHDGFKIHTSHIHIERIIKLAVIFNCKLIFTVRRNKLAQALSNVLATMTNVWHASDRDKFNESTLSMEEPFPADRFIMWLELMREDLLTFDKLMSTTDVEYRVVEFENLYSGSIESKISRLNELFNFIGVKKLEMYDKKIRSTSYHKIVSFFDSKKQKVTSSKNLEKQILNYNQLIFEYENWVSNYFLN